MVQRKAPAGAWDKGGGAEAKMRMMKGSRLGMGEHAVERSSFSSGRAAAIAVPNYMKPTSSSDARREQKKKKKVIAHHPGSSPCSSSSQLVSGPKSVRVVLKKLSSKSLRLSTKKSSGGVGAQSHRSVVNQATCSSTLKDSKFPRGLELSPGGTEAEGTSAVKVCPYKYCSLNGHIHGDGALPPLKCFLASRRKMLKSQKQMKQKGVSPFRKHGGGKDFGAGQAAAATRTRSGLEISSLIEEIGGDFFVEIYAQPQGLFTESAKCDDSSIRERDDDDETRDLLEGLSSGDDRDRSSEFSIDDLEVMMSFLEYVSCDREGEVGKDKPPNSMTEDCKESNIEADNQIQVSESIDIHLGEDADPFSDDRSSFSDDDELGPILGKLFENDLDTKSNSSGSVSDEKEVGLLDHGSVSTSDEVSEPISLDSCLKLSDEISEKRVLIDSNEGEKNDELSGLSDVQIPASNQELLELEEGNLNPNTAKEKGDKLIETEATDDDGGPKLRMIITRKERDEELEQLKDFNPRGPNFLPEVPDPESEKVDLKHQLMDERKNAEEWMIDYALQQAVTKLGPARRQKVALLVEAFETVSPIPPCEKPLGVHATASFSNPRPLQAC